MEKASWIKQQLKAWGYAGVTAASPVDKVIYLKKTVAEALSKEQMNSLGLSPANDRQFNSLRHHASGNVMVAFNYH